MRSSTPLPPEEIEFLKQLTPEKRNSRLSALRNAGWSLSVLSRGIGVPKTTVHFWTTHASKLEFTPKKPVPQPKISITKRLQGGQTLQVRFLSLNVPLDLVPVIRNLSSKSRRYRSRTPEGSPIAVANRELTLLAVNLHSQGVSTSALAEAAGVSYRAMARRIALGRKNA
jgi:lambda repressor-like predicted transcriptional regulator